MNAYATESSLGWLDFDAAASERVGTLLRSLEEPSTLDVLGLGTIRDAFAAMLSPGTTTIQTRLRYFIFLPWIFRGLEKERVPPGDFARRLRHEEARLIDCLRHVGANRGVIGYTAGRELKRMPSEIYWGGLGAWRIRRIDFSLAEYGKRLSALARHGDERDDDGSVTTRSVSMWQDHVPRPGDFLESDIGFELDPGEVSFLAGRIRRHHPDSLLAVLCGRPDLADGVDFPWELPAEVLPDDVQETLRHARCFSELILGPQLVYNVLVARRARDELGWDADDMESEQRARLAQWSESIGGRLDALASWAGDLAEFWNVLADHGVGDGTKGFVEEMVGSAVADPVGFADAPMVHARITERETRLKRKRARLTERAALESWNGEPVGGQFDYRWAVTRSYLADMAAAGGQG